MNVPAKRRITIAIVVLGWCLSVTISYVLARRSFSGPFEAAPPVLIAALAVVRVVTFVRETRPSSRDEGPDA